MTSTVVDYATVTSIKPSDIPFCDPPITSYITVTADAVTVTVDPPFPSAYGTGSSGAYYGTGGSMGFVGGTGSFSMDADPAVETGDGSSSSYVGPYRRWFRRNAQGNVHGMGRRNHRHP